MILLIEMLNRTAISALAKGKLNKHGGFLVKQIDYAAEIAVAVVLHLDSKPPFNNSLHIINAKIA